jgi:hypothetical protein
MEERMEKRKETEKKRKNEKKKGNETENAAAHVMSEIFPVLTFNQS